MALATWTKVARSSSRLSTAVVAAMAELPWFAQLTAEQRSYVGLIVQTGLGDFAEWLRLPDRPPPKIFAAAPRELTRAVSLKQTVQLIRIAVGVVEHELPTLASAGQVADLEEAVLRYSREIAFAAAEVYAAAAEARGAWDARVEAGVVEALLRGSAGELTMSRAASLGWGQVEQVVCVAARAPSPPAEVDGVALRALARPAGLSLLLGQAGGALLLLVGGPAPVPLDALLEALPPGPVVIGPAAVDLVRASVSVAEALAAFAVVEAWPAAPRPVRAADLLVERVVVGDDTARRRLLTEVYEPLASAGGDLLATVAAFVEGGGSIEATSRALFAHANTVRYRLNKLHDLLGLDVSRPRDAQLIRLALVLGRLPALEESSKERR